MKVEGGGATAAGRRYPECGARSKHGVATSPRSSPAHPTRRPGRVADHLDSAVAPGRPVKLPGGDAAIVDQRKLTDYCLNPEHPRGKHKARVFAALGFTADNADDLRAALVQAAARTDAQPAESDRHGDRYVVEFEVRGSRGSGTVRSTWIVRRGETAPRLTSCFLK